LRHEDLLILVMAPGSNDADMSRHGYWQTFLILVHQYIVNALLMVAEGLL